MAINLGTGAISKLYLGSNEIQKAYLGSSLVYDAAPAGGLLLDDYPNAAAAYSLRQLRTGVTNVIRVRESGGNTEQDFTAAQITDGTLTTFCGANDGYITVWYDQSGNSRDVTQATTSLQPRIVNAGSLELVNSKPALYFDGAGDFLRVVSSGTSTANTWLSIRKQTILTGYKLSTTYGVITASNGVNFMSFPTPTRVIFDNSGSSSVDGTATTNHELWTAKNGASAISMWVNGSLVTITNNARTLTSNLNDVRIGSDTYNDHMIGWLQEEILWQSTKSDTDVNAINSNINTHYGIY